MQGHLSLFSSTGVAGIGSSGILPMHTVPGRKGLWRMKTSLYGNTYV